jgi:pyrroline-5-carboxylate reductase
MKLSQTVGFLGAGNMAEALIKGLIAAAVVEPGQIHASTPRRERCDAIERKFGIVATTSNLDVVHNAEIVVLAVKPQKVALVIARRIFDAVGKTVLLDEEQMDAVTGLSGSGPAYVFLIIEALSDAGVKMGLARYNAQALAAQTVLGSAQLLLETNEHPGRLKDMVTSPGGTAIAGLHTLEAGGLRTTLINAVEAATRRSRELGELAESGKAGEKR